MADPQHQPGDIGGLSQQSVKFGRTHLSHITLLMSGRLTQLLPAHVGHKSAQAATPEYVIPWAKHGYSRPA